MSLLALIYDYEITEFAESTSVTVKLEGQTIKIAQDEQDDTSGPGWAELPG
jgi:hypothetical protein